MTFKTLGGRMLLMEKCKEIIKKGKIVIFGIALVYVLSFFVPYKLYWQRFTGASELQEIEKIIPYTVKIPKINVEAEIELVGLNQKGAMETPSNFQTVGWYKYGPTPGQIGNAVLAGHVDNALGGGGIFKNLDEVSFGDEIVTIDRQGEEQVFIVEEIEIVPWLDAPREKIFGETDEKRLNLITCTGSWSKVWNTYDDRMIIYATLKE